MYPTGPVAVVRVVTSGTGVSVTAAAVSVTVAVAEVATFWKTKVCDSPADDGDRPALSVLMLALSLALIMSTPSMLRISSPRTTPAAAAAPAAAPLQTYAAKACRG